LAATGSGKLVIVESPTKAKTVGRFLGKGYRVTASVGHIRDLPSNRMGVDIENHFAPRYIIPAGKTKIVKVLKENAKEAAEIYLATDPDREGEAISWHLQAALDKEIGGKPVKRVVFH
jgi:DNA topoisomerase-1